MQGDNIIIEEGDQERENIDEQRQALRLAPDLALHIHYPLGLRQF